MYPQMHIYRKLSSLLCKASFIRKSIFSLLVVYLMYIHACIINIEDKPTSTH